MQFRKGTVKRFIKLFALSIAIVIVSGLLVRAHLEAMRNSLREEVRQQLMAIAIAATFLVSPEEGEKIAQVRDPNDPLYFKTIAKLRALAQQTLPEIKLKGLKMSRKAIYILVPSVGTKWRFVLDTMMTYDRNGNGKIEEDEMQAKIGEEFDVSGFPELLRCFREGKPTADTNLTFDKWGVWLSGYAPLKDRNGHVIAVVGVDMNAEILAIKEKWLLQLSLITFAIITLTVLLLALLLYRWQSTYEQLSRAEELQRKLVDISADMILSLKPDGTISSVSPQIRNYGYEPKFLIGRSLTEFVSFEDKCGIDNLLKKLREGEVVQPCIVKVLAVNGQLRSGEWRCFGVYENNQLVEVWSIFRDLSQLLFLTQELKSKAEEMSKLSEEQSQLLEDIRRQAEQISVLDELVLAAIQRREIVSVAQIVIEGLKTLFPDTGLAILKYEPSNESIKVLAFDDRALKVLSQILLNPSKPISALNFQMLLLLQKGETVKLDDFSELSSEVAKVLSSEGYRSAIACPIHVGKDFLGFLLAFREKPNSFTKEEFTFLQRVTNHLAIALYNAQLFEELQRAYDELRQAQALLIQQERFKALGQMASGISHDIGNALVPLLAYAELLEENPDPKVRDWGKQIALAANDIMHIVQRLRAFYKPRDPTENLEPVDLNEIVRQVVDLTKPRWYDMPQREGITIDMLLDLDKNLPTIAGIPAELREALTNLIFNAIDAVVEKGEGKGKILIRTGKRNGFAFLEVSDTGIGMDEEARQHCLEPFFTTKSERGSGLGLMMVYGTMQRHEGQIEIESDLGKGSTFRLLFPIGKIELEGKGQEKAELEIQPLNILLVEDDPRVRGTLGELLKSWGHNVITAEDGVKAIDTFSFALQSGRPFDVVITDLGMPRMNGAELVRKIREHDQNVPIIIITAWGKEQFVVGANAALGKPVKSQDLKAALAKVVRQRMRESPFKGS